MKYVITALLAIGLSFSALAELNPRDQKLADLLLSGDMQRVKSAAKGIKDNEINNPELLDIAAEILLRKYENAYSSEVDTLAWLARAIGASENGRYYSALSEVVEGSGQKKLVRHAKSALGDIDEAAGEQYALGMYKLPDGLYAKEDDSVRDARILALLTEGDLASLKKGARAIVDRKVQSQALLDTAAEILITHYADAADNKIDTLSWVATALGQAKSGRYLAVLTEVEENGSHRKLRKYADRALENYDDTYGASNAQAQQYEKGMLGKALPSYDF
ncbi:hypothetical protein ACFO4O_16680 [Glaciecola siphonariae]|uniref:HEAT repeat domain-containing protein n=1 Tax=Glaciecola siphonariae TaxID=521012 RepID=A0ABV9M161_9ALTE